MSISNHLNKIKNAVFGKDVRGAIHDAIKQCYDDASINHDNANMEVKLARGTHDTLNDRLNKSDQNLAQTNAQLSQKADENKVKYVQSQIDSLVLGAVGDGNNAEVIQARAGENLLATRIEKIENGERLNLEYAKKSKNLCFDLIGSKLVNKEAVNIKQWNFGDIMINLEQGKKYLIFTTFTANSDNRLDTFPMYIRLTRRGTANTEISIAKEQEFEIGAINGGNGVIHKGYYFSPSQDENAYMTYYTMGTTLDVSLTLTKVYLLDVTNFETSNLINKLISYDNLNYIYEIEDINTSSNRNTINEIVEDLLLVKNEVIDTKVNLLSEFAGKILVNEGTSNIRQWQFTSKVVDFKSDKKYQFYLELNATQNHTGGHGSINIRFTKSGTANQELPCEKISYPHNNSKSPNIKCGFTLTVPNDISGYLDVYFMGGGSSTSTKFEYTLDKVFLIESELNDERDYETLFKESQQFEVKDLKIIDGLKKDIHTLNKKIDMIQSGNVDTTVVEIDCFGDSHTGGHYDGNTTSYPEILQELLGENYRVNNYGNGGETVREIVGRQGGLPYVLSPCTIPADTSLVPVEVKSYNGGSVGSVGRLWGWLPAEVDGIPVYFSLKDGQTYIYRVNAGTSSYEIKRPTIIRSKYMLNEKNNKDNILIVLMGTNGGYEDLDDLIAMHWNMIGNREKYIVVSDVRYDNSKFEEYNKRFIQEFGIHYLNAKEYIVKYGLDDLGLTPTQSELEQINRGDCPSRLKHDGVHYNQNGLTVLAKNCIYRHGKYLGYWK